MNLNKTFDNYSIQENFYSGPTVIPNNSPTVIPNNSPTVIPENTQSKQQTNTKFTNIDELREKLIEIMNSINGRVESIENIYGRLGDWEFHFTNFINLFNSSEFHNRSKIDWLKLKDIKKWDVSNITSFWGCFNNCKNFNLNLDTWELKTDSYINVNAMFRNTKFNQDLGSWHSSWREIIFPSRYDSNPENATGYVNSKIKFIFENCNYWGYYYIPDYLKAIKRTNVFKLIYSRCKYLDPNTFEIKNRDCTSVLPGTDVIERYSNQYDNIKDELDLNTKGKLTHLINKFVMRIQGSIVTQPEYVLLLKYLLGLDDSWIIKVNDLSRYIIDARSANHNKVHYFFMLNSKNYRQNINYSNWDVSRVTNMSELFKSVRFFRNFDRWDVSNVTNMDYMFAVDKGRETFKISNWNLESLESANNMFEGNSSFNEDISNWGITLDNLESASNMFKGCSSFNQNLNKWTMTISNRILNQMKFTDTTCGENLCGTQAPTQAPARTTTIAPVRTTTIAPVRTTTQTSAPNNDDDEKIFGLSPTLFYSLVGVGILILLIIIYVVYLKNTY